jgi:flagellar FliL protein
MPELRAEINVRQPNQELVLFAASLRLHKSNDQVYLQNAMPLIIDAFQSYFRDETVGSATQAVDIPKLKRVMLERINAILAPGKIDDILFREMTVQ